MYALKDRGLLINVLIYSSTQGPPVHADSEKHVFNSNSAEAEVINHGN